MHDLKESHLDAALKVIRYIKKSSSQGLLMQSYSCLELHAYCDAMYGSYPMGRCSTIGFRIMLGDFLISWKSKKLSIMSCFSTESVYRAMASTIYEIIWLLGLFRDLCVQLDCIMIMRQR